MPDIITHYRLGESALELLSPEPRAAIVRKLFDHATAGPDIWFSYRFWRPRQRQGKPERGNIMQHTQTGEFLLALAEQSKSSGARNELFSYLAGFLCHYALDRTAHPYIIYRSGVYNGDESTRANRGNHMLLEHALDRRTLRAWGTSLWAFPITRRILTLRRLPKAMRPALNAAYERVFGWENAWQDLNRGLRDQRRFYLLAQDPSGLLDAILRRVDGGVSHQDLTAISYHGKECPGVDVANEARLEWRHPCDPSLRFRESFDDLTRRAAHEAAAMIDAAWRYLTSGEAVPPQSAFASASYATGFPWRDPRNQSKPICDPLPLRKYQSKG